MLVSMWMSRELVTVSPQTTVADAAALMASRNVRRVLVVSGSGPSAKLVGIASARDLARAFPPDVNPFAPGAALGSIRSTVSEVMTGGVQTVTPETPIEEAARILRERKIGALPVEREGQLLGIITESDIFRAFIEVVGVRGGGVRVLFELRDKEKDDVVGTVLGVGRRHGLAVASILSMDHERRRLGVARLHGQEKGVDGFIEEMWKSGHRVLSVERAAAGAGRPSPVPAR